MQVTIRRTWRTASGGKQLQLIRFGVHRRRSLRSAYTHSNIVVSHDTFNQTEVTKKERKKEKVMYCLPHHCFDSPLKMRLQILQSFPNSHIKSYRLLIL